MGWVEIAVNDLDVSLPLEGRSELNCDQIERKPFEKLANMPNVVAFRVEVQRVRDFIDGEEDRALCKLLRDHTYKAKEDVARIVGETFACCFGKERKKRHQAKAASAPVAHRATDTWRVSVPNALNPSVPILTRFDTHKVRRASSSDEQRLSVTC
jgi:ubiquinone biosynthesis protein UbiJ